MKDETESIIDAISAVRAKNNINWMSILRIAIRHAPEETKAALRQIDACDRKVSDLVKVITG